MLLKKKMLPTDLLDAGLPQNFNCKKFQLGGKKKQTNTVSLLWRTIKQNTTKQAWLFYKFCQTYFFRLNESWGDQPKCGGKT